MTQPVHVNGRNRVVISMPTTSSITTGRGSCCRSGPWAALAAQTPATNSTSSAAASAHHGPQAAQGDGQREAGNRTERAGGKRDEADAGDGRDEHGHGQRTTPCRATGARATIDRHVHSGRVSSVARSSRTTSVPASRSESDCPIGAEQGRQEADAGGGYGEHLDSNVRTTVGAVAGPGGRRPRRRRGQRWPCRTCTPVITVHIAR